MRPASGLIQQTLTLKHCQLTRFPPSAEFSNIIENYWVVEWDLTDKQPYIQANLPHPAQHLVIDVNHQTGIFGVNSGRSSYRLAGRGRIFGVKFWPGAFHSLARKPVNTLTDKCTSTNDVFSVTDMDLKEELRASKSFLEFSQKIESLVRELCPEMNSSAKLVREIVAFIDDNKDLASVRTLTEHFDQSPKSLQRLFNTYVGVGPKCVIDRYRIIEAIDQLNNGGTANITELAYQLGYFDQAHFSKAFFNSGRLSTVTLFEPPCPFFS